MTLAQREHPEAVAEFDAAVRWYEDQEPGIGLALIDRARQARKDLDQWPNAAPPFTTADDGTVIVNLTGCFALGAVAQLAGSGMLTPEARAAVGAGFLGGFTTYSSFNQETIAMFSSGATGAAVLNVAVTLAGGLAAGLAGAAAVRMFQS